MILVSHDLGVIAETCDDIAVMYAGQDLEAGTAAPSCATPAIRTREALLQAMPSLEVTDERARAARHPAASRRTSPTLPPGCPFQPRCESAPTTAPRSMVALDADARRSRLGLPVRRRSRHDAAELAAEVSGLTKRSRERRLGRRSGSPPPGRRVLTASTTSSFELARRARRSASSASPAAARRPWPGASSGSIEPDAGTVDLRRRRTCSRAERRASCARSAARCR